MKTLTKEQQALFDIAVNHHATRVKATDIYDAVRQSNALYLYDYYADPVAKLAELKTLFNGKRFTMMPDLLHFLIANEVI